MPTFTPVHQVTEVPGSLTNWCCLASRCPSDNAEYPHCWKCRCEHV